MPSNKKNISLLTLGNTIVDLEYKVSDQILVDLDVEKGSMTLIDNNRKQHLLAALGSDYHLCNGGSVSNSLYIASKLGCNGHHIGVVGTDDLAQYVIDDFNANKIGHSFETSFATGDTGCCLVLITPDGERTMLTYLGVSSQFNNTDFMLPLVAQAEHVFIEGYLLADETCYNTILKTIIPVAKESNTRLILTLSDAGLVQFLTTQFNTIIELQFDMIFCNRGEAEALSGESSLEGISAFFNQRSAVTILTDGGNGAYIIGQSDTIHCPCESVVPVDSTGAGDAFAGAYIASSITGSNPKDAGNIANIIAKLVISTMGARPSTDLRSLIMHSV